VLEALRTDGVHIDKLLLARKARGDTVDAIEREAAARGVEIRRVDPAEVTRISRNRKQDQGAVADVVAPRMEALSDYLGRSERPTPETLLLLDGLTTPANVGMVIRSATAAGLTGIIVPRNGCPEVGPLVVKASAGVAFRARILRTPDVRTAAKELQEAKFELVGLDANADESLYEAKLPPRLVIAVGNETTGLSDALASRLDRRWSIPLADGVESLNAAVAASVVAFELARRQRIRD
jgi:23S rRNA (guanosine2251-2'-O)-methyltransferase